MSVVNKIKLPNNTTVDINDARITGIDSTPTSSSDNLVTSGGVYRALLGEIILDTSSIVANRYIDRNNGAETNYNGWSATSYIDLTGIAQIKANKSLTYNAYYNSSKGFVSAVNVGPSYVAVPDNAQYIRLSGTTSDMTSLVVTAQKSGGSGGGGGSLVSWGTESGYTVPLTVDGVSKTICLNGYSAGGGSGVSDVTLGGTSVVSNDIAVLPAYPTVPTISTNIASDASSDAKTASPKAVKTYVDGIVGDIETLLAAI